MSDIVERLEPCPFCGGEASADGLVSYGEKTVQEQGWNQSTFYYCNCVRCGSSNQGLIGHQSRQAAIMAWNNRPAAAELTRLRARVEELEKALKPFADVNERLAPYEMDGLHPTFTATYRDFRAAARALRKD